MKKIFAIIVLLVCFGFSLFYDALEDKRIKPCKYEKKYYKDHEVCRFHSVDKLYK